LLVAEYDHVVAQARAVMLNKLIMLPCKIMWKETLASRDQSQTIIAKAGQVPLFSITGIVPTFPKCGADALPC
jgi:hypothetical protein